jgi:hypothetical protein
MKRFFLCLSTLMLLGVPWAWSDDVRVGADIHLRFGDPAPAPYAVLQPPLFLYPRELGFYVAVGVPFGLFYIDNYYYAPRGGVWYGAPHYNGPWYYVKPGHLPPGLVKHRYRDIIYQRDIEYRNYSRDRDHYHGQKYHPEDRYSKGKGGDDRGKGRGHGSDHGRGRDD